MNDFEKACNDIDKRFTGEVMQENVIEFVKNADVATVNFCQGRYISKIKKMADKFPDECEIVSESDGCIVAHVPVKWIHVSRHSGREMSDEERAAAAERLRKVRKKE